MGIFRFDRKGQIEGFEEKPSAARLEEMGGSLPAGATTDFTTPPASRSWPRWGSTSSPARRWSSARREPTSSTSATRLSRRRSAAEGARLRLQRLLGRRRHAALVLRRQHLARPSRAPSSASTTRRGPSSRGRASCRRRGSMAARCAHRRLRRRLGVPRRRRGLDRRPAHAGLRGREGEARRAARRRRVRRSPGARRLPPLGIGHDAVLENVIVDKNARIGDGAILVNSAGIVEGEARAT